MSALRAVWCRFAHRHIPVRGMIIVSPSLPSEYSTARGFDLVTLIIKNIIIIIIIIGRVPEQLETKYLLFLLFGLGGVAVWSGSEAVLPAYIISMVLAGTVARTTS
jgi:hypothetical protein